MSSLMVSRSLRKFSACADALSPNMPPDILVRPATSCAIFLPQYTPEEEDRIIEAEFRDVLNGYLSSNHRKKVEIIERAFRFAKEAHKGIRRRSGT